MPKLLGIIRGTITRDCRQHLKHVIKNIMCNSGLRAVFTLTPHMPASSMCRSFQLYLLCLAFLFTTITHHQLPLPKTKQNSVFTQTYLFFLYLPQIFPSVFVHIGAMSFIKCSPICHKHHIPPCI